MRIYIDPGAEYHNGYLFVCGTISKHRGQIRREDINIGGVPVYLNIFPNRKGTHMYCCTTEIRGTCTLNALGSIVKSIRSYMKTYNNGGSYKS